MVRFDENAQRTRRWRAQKRTRRSASKVASKFDSRYALRPPSWFFSFVFLTLIESATALRSSYATRRSRQRKNSFPRFVTKTVYSTSCLAWPIRARFPWCIKPLSTIPRWWTGCYEACDYLRRRHSFGIIQPPPPSISPLPPLPHLLPSSPLSISFFRHANPRTRKVNTTDQRACFPSFRRSCFLLR